jgi:vacuolar-type H+-ATPase subunit F/Vma7
MNADVRVLCRPELAGGFLLAGARVVEVSTAVEAALALRDMLDEPAVGVVLLEEQLHDQLPDDLRRTLGKRPLPMVVPFPDPAWEARPDTADSYIVELLRQVIGYRVRLR